MFASGSKDIDAKVVNNALVVAFNSGDTPRVWRADMTHLQTAALEVRAATEKGKFELVLKSANNDDVVSVFPNKDEAAAALRLMTAAMMQSEKAPQIMMPKGNIFFRIIKWAFGIFFVIVLFLLWHLLFGGPVGGRHMGAQNFQGLNNGPAPVQQGVPMPANQLFDQ